MATTVYQEGQTDNGFGTAGLVLGIISFVLCFVPLIGLLVLPLALLGTVLGGVGLLRASGGRATNFSSSATGLALSMVSGLVVTACIALIVALGNTTSNVEELKLPSTVYYTNVGLRSTGLHPASRDAVDLGKPVEIPEFAGTGSARVTVDKFVPDAQSSDEFWTASPGNKLVAAHVIVTNTGQTTYTNASWLGSKVYTNRGQGYDNDSLYSTTAGPDLPMNIDLKPGGSIDGWVTFEIPAANTVESVTFDDAEWKVTTGAA